jgi:hypothetical protein
LIVACARDRVHKPFLHPVALAAAGSCHRDLRQPGTCVTILPMLLGARPRDGCRIPADGRSASYVCSRSWIVPRTSATASINT